jgi:NAD(P)-dependent dehydrogenase (short-subunit alcohol dehydrogenase family)
MKNYLIIGGSTGIGAQTAAQLAMYANVYATYNKNAATNTNNINYHSLNVLDETLDLSFLPDTIDGLVYCPGSINLKPFARIKAEDFVQDYQLQVVGAIKIIQSILPKLKISSHASIVLFSTVAVQNGLNFHSLVAASKGAIEGLTKALAAELAPTIRVNCIAPGLTNTPLAGNLLNTPEKIEANAQKHPLKRIGTPTDIANMVEFLLSDKSSWVTGQVLHIDGGMDGIKM